MSNYCHLLAMKMKRLHCRTKTNKCRIDTNGCSAAVVEILAHTYTQEWKKTRKDTLR